MKSKRKNHYILSDLDDHISVSRTGSVRVSAEDIVESRTFKKQLEALKRLKKRQSAAA